MIKKPYREGDVVLVPLQGGYGVGVIARMAASPQRGTVWGYFFVFEERPTLANLTALQPEGAQLCCIFGDLHLIRGPWEVLGPLPNWDRTRWPMLPLRRTSEPNRVIIYDPDDPSKELIMRPITAEEADQGLPKDGLSGAGAVEIRLQRLLDARYQAAPAPAA